MSDYEQDDYDNPPSRHGTGNGGSRPGPTAFVLGGFLVGLILGFVLAWVLGGNPFSSANEVVYTDVVVGSVSEEADRICWAEDPERRDSDQTCAILALDPELDVPQAGDTVTIGIVEFRTPDGSEFTQVVHVAPAGVDAVEGTETEGDETDDTGTPEDQDTTGDPAGATPGDDATT